MNSHWTNVSVLALDKRNCPPALLLCSLLYLIKLWICHLCLTWYWQIKYSIEYERSKEAGPRQLNSNEILTAFDS